MFWEGFGHGVTRKDPPALLRKNSTIANADYFQGVGWLVKVINLPGQPMLHEMRLERQPVKRNRQKTLLIGSADTVGARVVGLLKYVLVVGQILQVESYFVGHPGAVNLVPNLQVGAEIRCLPLRKSPVVFVYGLPLSGRLLQIDGRDEAASCGRYFPIDAKYVVATQPEFAPGK